jgi:prevent-host-death family protein
MERTVSVRDLRNHTASVMNDVKAGHSVILTSDGEPIAEIRPLGRHAKLQAIIERARQTPGAIEEADRWYAEHVADKAEARELEAEAELRRS